MLEIEILLEEYNKIIKNPHPVAAHYATQQIKDTENSIKKKNYCNKNQMG